jgi:hypothetical protein
MVEGILTGRRGAGLLVGDDDDDSIGRDTTVVSLDRLFDAQLPPRKDFALVRVGEKSGGGSSSSVTVVISSVSL